MIQSRTRFQHPPCNVHEKERNFVSSINTMQTRRSTYWWGKKKGEKIHPEKGTQKGTSTPPSKMGCRHYQTSRGRVGNPADLFAKNREYKDRTKVARAGRKIDRVKPYTVAKQHVTHVKNTKRPDGNGTIERSA